MLSFRQRGIWSQGTKFHLLGIFVFNGLVSACLTGTPLGVVALAQELILPVPGLDTAPSGQTSDPTGTTASDSDPTGEVRSSQKAVVPASAEKLDAEIKGMTYVALSQDLRRIADGKEPSTLAELKELESQQSRVAKAIQQVTVNIQQGSAQGSGVIITSDGFVLTAAHVAGGAGRSATVVLHDGRQLRAETLGMNRDKDAGLVRILNGSQLDLPHATLGRSSDVKVGQWCIGAGHPGGWQPERGTVIRVGRILKRQESHTLFTDCALIGGDSGGPLFTLDGKLIGVHSRIGAEVSENMHVPIDVFSRDWDDMVRKKVWGVLPGFDPPYIGVTGNPKNEGRAEITAVEPDGPADLAGVQPGDVIQSVDDKPIRTFQDLEEAVRSYAPGDFVVLRVRRGEAILQMPITIGARQSGHSEN